MERGIPNESTWTVWLVLSISVELVMIFDKYLVIVLYKDMQN